MHPLLRPSHSQLGHIAGCITLHKAPAAWAAAAGSGGRLPAPQAVLGKGGAPARKGRLELKQRLLCKVISKQIWERVHQVC